MSINDLAVVSQFVRASDADIPAIVDLMNRAYRGSGTSASWSTEAAYIAGTRTTEDLLRADMEGQPEASLLLWPGDHEGILIGCVWVEPLGNDVWYLGSLAIEPDRQDSGLGRSLLSATEQWIGERGGKRIQMRVVNVREALIAWYLRRGYRLTGETEPFPYGDDRFGTPLRDDLCFVVLEKHLARLDGIG